MGFESVDGKTHKRMTEEVAKSAEDVLEFWFAEGRKELWFNGGDDFDRLVEATLGPLHRQAAMGALDDWAATPRGALALVLLLDQVPRNVYRQTPQAYATDPQARRVAHEAVEAGLDRTLGQVERVFLYLPFEHREDLDDQELCCRLMSDLDENPDWLDFAERHRDLIARFGRFPHRNAILGRPCTPKEDAYLAQPGAGF